MRDTQHKHHDHSHNPDSPERGSDTCQRRQHHGEHGHPHGEHADRNFWDEWRSERHHHHHGPHGDFPAGRALAPQEMEAWREFFNQTFGTLPENHWIFGGRRFSPWHQGIDSFNPFAAALLSKGGGLLPLYTLHLISRKPRYGNEIMDLLAERTHGQWVANPGAIYPLLAHLEKEGFIEGRWEDPDKRTIRIYAITDAGQVEIERIRMIVTPKLIETVEVLQDLIDDLQTQVGADATETGSL